MTKRSRKFLDILYLIAPAISIAVFVLFWYVSASRNPEFIPTPAMTVERFARLFSRPINGFTAIGHALVSLKRVLGAVAVATVVGVIFGLLLGWYRTFRKIFNPVFLVLRPIPPIAWIPIVTIWFGVGEFARMLIVFISSFVAIVINTETGVRVVDPFIVRVGRSFGANGRQSLWEIVLPSALPAIFAGIKTSIGTGWMTILAAELITSKTGLGFLIVRGMEAYDIPLVLVGMVMIGVVGALLAALLTFVERRLVKWAEI